MSSSSSSSCARTATTTTAAATRSRRHARILSEREIGRLGRSRVSTRARVHPANPPPPPPLPLALLFTNRIHTRGYTRPSQSARTRCNCVCARMDVRSVVGWSSFAVCAAAHPLVDSQACMGACIIGHARASDVARAASNSRISSARGVRVVGFARSHGVCTRHQARASRPVALHTQDDTLLIRNAIVSLIGGGMVRVAAPERPPLSRRREDSTVVVSNYTRGRSMRFSLLFA